MFKNVKLHQEIGYGKIKTLCHLIGLFISLFFLFNTTGSLIGGEKHYIHTHNASNPCGLSYSYKISELKGFLFKGIGQ